jgi:ergothioneine biosynthesis protein EgtB
MDRDAALAHFRDVRALTTALVAPLSAEDALLQAMPDVSPAKWHLAHTTWFFEAFVLGPLDPDFKPFDADFGYLFNSYYEAQGPRHPRAQRGLISRPSLARVRAWRDATDAAVARFIATASERCWTAAAPRITLGLHHEQQHQELLASDMKFNLATQPGAPAWRPRAPGSAATAPLSWHTHPGGVVEIGHAGEDFAFDNERPRHRAFVEPFALADRLVTNAEVAAFRADGGYRSPSLWLSDGWAWVQAHGVDAPLYWHDRDGALFEATLHGLWPLDPARPASHLSAYEAEAVAAWLGARLPTEFEWEVMAADVPPSQSGLDPDGEVHPAGAGAGHHIRQLDETLWQWTRSAYLPYPGFRPLPGALGEYNGKFMSGQWVLRGGCVATPAGHSRRTYRNFYHPHQRWPFTGLRLARDV